MYQYIEQLKKNGFDLEYKGVITWKELRQKTEDGTLLNGLYHVVSSGSFYFVYHEGKGDEVNKFLQGKVINEKI